MNPAFLGSFPKPVSGGGVGGTFTLIDHKLAAALASATATTAAIDTTGAKLIVLCVGSVAAVTVTDGKGNTLTALTSRAVGGIIFRLYYVINPASVGSGHTFSAQASNSWPMISVTAWTYTGTTPAFDNENGATSSTSVASIATGAASSVTGGRVVIAGMSWADTGSTVSGVDNSFTIADQARNGATNIGLVQAYLLQSSGASVNPTYTFAGGNESNVAAGIAAFK